MAQGRSTKVNPVIKWIRTNRLSIKNSLSGGEGVVRNMLRIDSRMWVGELRVDPRVLFDCTRLVADHCRSASF